MDTNVVSAQPSWETERKRNKKKGVLFCAGPPIGFILTLIMYGVMAAVLSVLITPQNAHLPAPAWMRGIYAFLGIFGIVSFTMIPVGAIIGIVYLSRGPSGPPPSEPPTQPPQPPQL